VDRLSVAVMTRLATRRETTTITTYFDLVNAPSKELVWFEKSANTPHLERATSL